MAEELNTYNLQLQQVEAALTSEPDNQVSSGGEILKIYKNIFSKNHLFEEWNNLPFDFPFFNSKHENFRQLIRYEEEKTSWSLKNSNNPSELL